MTKKMMMVACLVVTLVACSSPPKPLETPSPLPEQVVSPPEAIKDSPNNHSRGMDGEALLNNPPTRQILRSLESVAETLNLLTFGLFATEKP
ncbi:hypothetical protein ACODM8_12355 [Vibrio ostreicida]|uniref:Uncharacterized protein n=1 Tax=Vibrio ostreicida TaxID=526588 RepID=A0ABT8BZW5_9VIBR|nr:hypothetical protein [Vibrio ostreicida]MDN3612357.1 hypothetical protein [Vibrio ostreicida]NPD09872.1 hypothetical protein [Vibrio ostreicida]